MWKKIVLESSDDAEKSREIIKSKKLKKSLFFKKKDIYKNRFPSFLTYKRCSEEILFETIIERRINHERIIIDNKKIEWRIILFLGKYTYYNIPKAPFCSAGQVIKIKCVNYIR